MTWRTKQVCVMLVAGEYRKQKLTWKSVADLLDNHAKHVLPDTEFSAAFHDVAERARKFPETYLA